jgi:hypothetical protein
MAVASFEGEVHKEQHEREKGWKEKQRETKNEMSTWLLLRSRVRFAWNNTSARRTGRTNKRRRRKS